MKFLLQYKNTKKQSASPTVFLCKSLLFHDLKHIHRTDLDTDAASDALTCRAVGLHNHNLHGTDLDTLAAADTELFIDHVNTGLGILRNSAVLASLHAFAALDASHRLGTGTLGNDLNTAQIRMKLFVECIGAGSDALQASHTLCTFFRH